MRKRNLKNKMGLDDASYKNLRDVVHDVIIEVIYELNTERKPTCNKIDWYTFLLSDDVLLDVEKWGASDTLVRERIHEEIENIDTFEKQFILALEKELQ